MVGSVDGLGGCFGCGTGLGVGWDWDVWVVWVLGCDGDGSGGSYVSSSSCALDSSRGGFVREERVFRTEVKSAGL